MRFLVSKHQWFFYQSYHKKVGYFFPKNSLSHCKSNWFSGGSDWYIGSNVNTAKRPSHIYFVLKFRSLLETLHRLTAICLNRNNGYCQCCRFSRNVAQVTPKMNYFDYQINIFLGSKYPKKHLIYNWKKLHWLPHMIWWQNDDLMIEQRFDNKPIICRQTDASRTVRPNDAL